MDNIWAVPLDAATGRGNHLLMDPNETLGSVLAQWGEWQRAGNLSLRTITERAAVLRRFLLWAEIGPFAITAQLVVRYLDRANLTPGTRATYYGHLRAYGTWLVRTHRTENNPVLDAPSPRRNKGVPRPITGGQLQAVLAVVNRRRTRMMFLLAAFQGLRVHEIAKVRGQDFDLEAGVLYVTGKGGKTAMLPVHTLVAEAAVGFDKLSW